MKNFLKCGFSSKTVISNNQDILKNFTKITSLERFNLIFKNSYKAITCPTEYFLFFNSKFQIIFSLIIFSGTHLSHLGDLVSYSSLMDIKEKMK